MYVPYINKVIYTRRVGIVLKKNIESYILAEVSISLGAGNWGHKYRQEAELLLEPPLIIINHFSINPQLSPNEEKPGIVLGRSKTF